MDVRQTKLYKTVAPCIRKEDREEFARMLQMVADRGKYFDGDAVKIIQAFTWRESPQGYDYWSALHRSLREAGHYE